jgi:hypothetical protein
MRFVIAAWLLLAGLAFASVGWFTWSHVEAHHRVVGTAATVCLFSGNDRDAAMSNEALRTAGSDHICPGDQSHVVGEYMTPNRVPGAVLIALAAVVGGVGLVLLRRGPSASPIV